MDEAMEGLCARVRALERQDRRQRTVMLAALALLAAAGVSGARVEARKQPAEVEARRFVLVAADGRPLAALEATPEGTPRLALLEKAGAARLTLALAADGAPSIALADSSGRQRVLLDTAGDEARVSVAGEGRSAVTLANGGIAPRLALADAAGNDRLWVALRLGSPAVQFLDTGGVARSGLTTFNDDAGVAVVSGTEKTSPGLVLYGKDRTIVWSAP